MVMVYTQTTSRLSHFFPEEMDTEGSQNHLSIYRAARSIKRRDNTLYNALRSIHQDSIFVAQISHLWPHLPLLANLRCGLWYSPNFHSTCYFKSTDGHTNNLSFNTSRLNLHVASLAAQTGGCIIVDSTRKGKRFPDSMSKTIPIWSCVLNRFIHSYLKRTHDSPHWDCALHLPLWVPQNERAKIEERLESWTRELECSGVDVSSLALRLKKPLRPLWISPKSVIWINEVPDSDSWHFTPIILVSASSSSGTGLLNRSSTTAFSWNYIPGAGDDEESWARGLTPGNFWSHAHDVISLGPDFCNQKVAEIVEKDRVYRAQRGQNVPQLNVKTAKVFDGKPELNDSINELPVAFDMCNGDIITAKDVFWLGSTNVAVGMAEKAVHASNVDCILNCNQECISINLPDSQAYLHLPMVSSKVDRYSLLNNLPAAVNFAKVNLRKGNRLLVCCSNGEDMSVCVSLAILTCLFCDEGTFDDGRSFHDRQITKLEMRRRLIFICNYAASARPSRGNLKQVFAFLRGGGVASVENNLDA